MTEAPSSPSSSSSTASSPVSSSAASPTGNQPNFIAIEHEIQTHWEKEGTFKQLQKNLEGKPLFRFLDGPITANNPMGVHHAWGRTLKDIFIRYKTLQGHACQFQNGFDCQGLWVEVEVEKELGFKGKPDIEAFGLDKFSQACKARIDKFSQIQTKQSERLGQWMEWDDSYYTHTDHNIQGIWKFLKTCKDNDWLYRSYLPMPWCTRCGTSLSEHEMSGSYKDMEHLAVYIKPLLPKLGARILVWTTTPWTLPANAALAVNPELEYSMVKVDGEDLPLILSSEVLRVWSQGGWKTRNPTVLKTMKGSELEGTEYEAIFADLPVQKTFAHRIVLWKEVDPKEGTGVVHIAPGCGREDFELSTQVAIERIIPVDEKGEYVKGYGALEGKSAKAVANEVAEYLSKSGQLYSKYQHKHSYPVCWRCKDELIFRLVGEWYISSKDVRPKLIEAARTVKWQPEHVGKRMEDWLNNMGDWCISRKRFWGLPLPFYCCPSCETLTVIGSKEELQALSPDDLSKVPELHRPWIDSIRVKCPKCATLVQRIPEVGDCWLDAGIVPYSTRGCYERGQEGKAEAWAPADWICEMSEQVRLWFYSMLFMGVTLGKQAPYKHVLTYERVLAEDGTKFSKTGYMIKFDEAAEKMGVDTMRYYFASQAPTNDLRFGYAQGDDARRQLISLWNIYSFFMTYAELDKPVIDPKTLASPATLSSTDRWLLASVIEFEREAKKSFEEYNTAAVVRAFEEFIEGVSNWYIRSNRRRFWKSESSNDKAAGYAALFQALRTASVVMAPIMPFLTEKIWQSCIRKFAHPSAAEPASVHLAQWPELPESWAAPGTVKSVAHVRQALNIALRLRSESKIKVRQPLPRLSFIASPEQEKSLREMESVILGELNVKGLDFLKSKEEVFAEFLELDLKKSGPVLRGDVGKVVAVVNALSPEVSATLLALIKSGKPVTLPGYEKELPAEIFVIKLKPRPNTISAEESGIFVVLDTTVTKELEEEGWVRDVLRQIQVLRKESGLEVQDRIELAVATGYAPAAAVLKRERSAIEAETLGSILETLATEDPGVKPLGATEVELSTLQGEEFKVSIALRKRASR